MELRIPLMTSARTTFTLSPEQGNQLRELILLQITTSFRHYVNETVGLADSNVSAILSGKRPLSLFMLQKILSGTRMELVECTLNFTLENTAGGIVPRVQSQTIEEMLSSQEMNESDQEPPLDPSLPLVKDQGKLKTLLGIRSWENPDASSD